MNALVTGASSGIGLALVKKLCARPDIGVVFATCRTIVPGSELAAEARANDGRLHIVPCDVTSDASLARAAAHVGVLVPRLHYLINTAGILHDAQVSPERRLEHADADTLAAVFAVNAIGPLLVAKHFFRLLAHDDRAVYASLSARVGSIGDNRIGGWYGYRASKAAQNMVIKTLSIELARRARNAVCVALHPGTVDTDLSKPFQRNVPPHQLFSPSRAADQLLDIIDSLTTADTGAFLDWKRDPIPW